MPENYNPSSSDHAMAEMNQKVDIILAKLRKTQKEFAKYKEKNPETPISQEMLTPLT